MSLPSVSISDAATRQAQVDVGIKGSLGGFNLVRKYVSSDKTWAYLSMLGKEGSAYVARPFGASRTSINSLRWWHSLYSFVFVRGRIPGVSTWAVRDTEGAILEYVACAPAAGEAGCFATPRERSRWSTAQLYWTENNGGRFILVKPGEGRFTFAAEWRPTYGSSQPGSRYFLSSIDDDVLNGSGSPRTRLVLSYARPFTGCPGESATGNGVPFLNTVTTEDGSLLKLYYKRAWGFGREECVLGELALRDNPNAGSTTEKVVARFRYLTSSTGRELAGELASVVYPETGDTVSYNGDSSSWSTSVNGEQVAAHTYTSEGKVSSISTQSAGTQVLSLSGGSCPIASSGGTCPDTMGVPRSAGDSAGSLLSMKREFLRQAVDYMPYMPVVGFSDTCLSSDCTGFSAGSEISTLSSLDGGFLYLSRTTNKGNVSDVFQATVADAGTAYSSVPQPIARETRTYGVTGAADAGLYTETSETHFGAYPLPGTPEPFRFVDARVDSRDSVLVAGEKATMTTSYDPGTRRLKSFIQKGYTVNFDPGTKTWSAPVVAYVGTFYFNHHKCSGAPASGGGQVLEVHGPCAVSSSSAADCEPGTDFPITQYHYYGPPGVEPSNRANRLQKVKRFVSYNGYSCAGASALETTFLDYDARGNVTRLADTQGLETLLEYQGGRLKKATAPDGLATTYWYDGGQLLSVGQPTGVYSVQCYRGGTVNGQGCTEGTKSNLLMWEAIASDKDGRDWTEGVFYDYWPGGSVKKAEYRTKSNGVMQVRRVVEYHPDAHDNPTYTRWGVGPGSFAATGAFNATGEQTGVGLPFNAPPDFCKDAQTASMSQLCTALGYDASGRLTQITERPVDGVSQTSTFTYDQQGNVDSVRVGCADAANCTQPTSTYQYDDFGNLVRVKLPHATNTVNYAYDARGNLLVKQTGVMRSAGEWVENTYDGLSRLRTSTRRSSSSTLSSETLFRLGYDNDEDLPLSCIRPDGQSGPSRSLGRLLFREDSFGRTWYRYDTGGRLIDEYRQRHGETLCNPMLGTQYHYELGRLKKVVYPYGRTVSYVYGVGAAAGRVTGVNVSLFDAAGQQVEHTLVSHIIWEPFGGLRGYQLNSPTPTGSSRSVEYALGDDGSVPPSDCDVGFPSPGLSDQTGRLRSLRVSSGEFVPGAGSGDIYKRTYTWKADQVARIDTCLLGSNTPRIETYQYDRTLRLTEASRPAGNFEATGGAFLSQKFNYDSRGNRTSLTQWKGARKTGVNIVEGTDKLLSTNQLHDSQQRVTYAFDGDGRVSRKDSGLYYFNAKGEVAHRLDMRYRPTSTVTGWGSAREDVFRVVTVRGATYSYFYDALGRRRAKVHPLGARDEFFHGPGNELLVDQGWNDVVGGSPGYRTVDDYVWLAGRPLVLLRGRLADGSDTHASDMGSCPRNGEAAACGAYFPVTDHIGKPVLMLDGVGRVAGAADYEPFGHVNRVTLHDATPHPYPDGAISSISTLTQSPENSQVQVRMRALFQFVDTQADDFVSLVDANTGTELTRNSGYKFGRWVSDWVQPSAGSVAVKLSANAAGTTANTNNGAVLESYEYQRYQAGAQPFWTPVRFPGQYHDAETDLFENWNRYYDPSIGRYLQPEPMLGNPMRVLLMATKGGVAAYSYAANNPLTYIDPTGLDYIEYNGRELKWVFEDKATGRVLHEKVWPAGSGTASMGGIGVNAIPPGTYEIEGQVDREIKKASSGADWGGGFAWRLHEGLVTRILNRVLRGRDGGFFIHGGYSPGTAGCVEFKDYEQEQEMLNDFDAVLMDYLRSGNDSIYLYVDY
jgi:RHS repeat-associated protein